MGTCLDNIKKRKYNLEYLQKNITPEIGYFTKHDENSSYYLGTLILNNKESKKTRGKLRDNGCEASFHYPYLHQTKHYNHDISLNNLENLYDRIINLPIHQNLSATDLNKIVGVINEK